MIEAFTKVSHTVRGWLFWATSLLVGLGLALMGWLVINIEEIKEHASNED